MKRLIPYLAMFVTFCLASATSWAETTSPAAGEGSTLQAGSFLLQSVALLIVIACVLVAFRFYSAIRGGRVGRGWMWVFCGFLVLTGAQLLLFGGELGVLPVLMIWVDALRVVSLLLFFVGINQLRKVVA